MPNSKKETLRMGQIIYILSNKGNVILPAMVVEEEIKKTLIGKETVEKIDWKVAIGAGDKRKIVNASNISGEVYLTLKEIESSLEQRLTAYLNGVISDANKRESIWYKDLKNPEPPQTPEPVVESEDDSLDPEAFIQAVDSAVSQPGSQPDLQPSGPMIAGGVDLTKMAQQSQSQSIEEKLRRSMIPTEEEIKQEELLDQQRNSGSEPLGQTTITAPDGTKMKVNLIT